jgi:hypothetical protein
LDLYRGQYDFKNFSTQIHDFDPGIHPYPGGLFWTVPKPTLGEIELEEGTASMRMHRLAVNDFFNIPNALLRLQVPVSADAHCSFDIKWTGPVTSTGPVTTPGSTGELAMTSATMTWSASNSLGFRFESNPKGTTSAFAQLGRVRNGIFADDDD